MPIEMRVINSFVAAQYDEVSMELHHNYKVYALEAPLKFCSKDRCELVDDHLEILFSDGTKLVLKAKSADEVRDQYISQAKKLRALRQKHAKKALMLAKTIKRAVKALVKVEDAMQKDAVAIAGELYESNYTVSFEPHGSNDAQVDSDGFVTTPDFASALKMATETVELLEPVASAAEPLPLPFELVEFD